MTFAVQSPFFCLVESWVALGLQSSGTAGEKVDRAAEIHSFIPQTRLRRLVAALGSTGRVGV